MTSTRWPGGIWVVVITAMLATLSLTFLFGAYVRFATSGECQDPTTATALRDARMALVAQLVVVLGAWCGVAVWRRRARIAALGLVASAYAAGAVVHALMATRADWTGWAFCF